MAKRSNGEGTAIKFNDRLGRYEQRIGYKLDGKNKIKAFYGKTVKEIKEKVKAWEKSKDYGLNLQADKITYAEWAENWLDVYKKPMLEVSSYKDYLGLYKKHIMPTIGHMKLKDIKRIILQNLLNGIYANGLSIASVKNIRRFIVSSFKQAKLDNLILNNPADGLVTPKETLEDVEKEVNPFLKDELLLLMKVAKTKEIEESAPYMYNLIYLLLYTGSRIGEVLGLEWRHVDLDKKVIYIRQSRKMKHEGIHDIIGKLKTKKSKRDIPIDEKVITVLKQQRVLGNHNKLALGEDYYKDKDFVFSDITGMGLTHHAVRYHWNKLIRLAGLKHRGIHQLRHTFASIAIQRGVNIKQLSAVLGHAKVNITYDTYGHLFPGDTQNVISAVSDFMCN